MLSSLALLVAAACFLGGPVSQAHALNSDICGGDVFPVIGPFEVSCTYTTGDIATFTVPAGVTTLHVSATSASGQKGEDGSTYDTINCVPRTSSGGAGGVGESITGDVTVVPNRSDVTNDHQVSSDDQLQVNVDSGAYTGGRGGHGHHTFIIECGLDIPTLQPITSGNGGAGGAGAALTDTSIASGQPRLDMVAAGGGGGGGGGSSKDYAFGFASAGQDGGNGGCASCGTGGLGNGDNVLETSNGDIFGGSYGGCLDPTTQVPLTLGCEGQDAPDYTREETAFIGAGGGGGGAGRNGGGGGQAGYQNCLPVVLSCTVFGEAGAGGGAGVERVPGGWVRTSHAGDASLTISWTNTDRPVTGISLSPSKPNGSNGWYLTAPTINVVSSDLGVPLVQFCSLDPTTVPTNIGDFGGLPAGQGPGCNPSDLTEALTPGPHTLYAMAEDQTAQTTSDVVSVSWNYDPTAPKITFSVLGGLQNAGGPPGTFFTNVGVEVCATDTGSGLDASKIPGLDTSTGCVNQVLNYADDTTATSQPVTFYDIAGNQVTYPAQTISFDAGVSDPVVLAGNCGFGPECANLLTTQEGGSVELVGDIEAPTNDTANLTIDWGDGSTPTTASYPCAQGDQSCPFTPLSGPPQEIAFTLHHTYANNRPGNAPYQISVTNQETGIGVPSTAVTTTADVTNAPPTLALAPDCGPLCVYGSTLTVSAGAPVSLSGQVTDPGPDSGTVTIDWGDGSAQTTVPFDCGTSGELCPTPSLQNMFCGLFVPGSTACGYFSDAEHSYADPGSYTISATAIDQDGGTSTTQTTTATVSSESPPLITSADHSTLPEGSAGSFTVTTTPGEPAATILTESGPLPSGVSFTDNGDGTATLAGTPAAGSGGSYPLTLRAANTAGHTDQAFTLTVTELPAITSADHTTFSVGSGGTFTVATHAGFPTATTVTETGGLPSGVSFTDNGDGTATLAGTPALGTVGGYLLTLRASNTAGHTDQAFTLTVGKASQSITFGSLPNKLYGAAPFAVSATASSGLAVSFSSDTPGVCTVSGSTVTLKAAGTCTIRAKQAGNANYLPATDVTQSFVIGYTLTNLAPPNKSTFKHGSAIPVKFQLTGAGGVPIPASVATTLGCHVTVTFDGAAPVCAVYSTNTGYFQATIKTTGSKAGQTYPLTITVTASDSTPLVTRTVQVTAT